MFRIIIGLWMGLILGAAAQDIPNREDLTEEASLDIYLNKHIGSNEYYDAYDQPNIDVWHEYVSYEEELSGIDKTTETFADWRSIFSTWIGIFQNQQGGGSPRHAENFWPVAIEDESLNQYYQDLQERASEAYQEDETLDKIVEKIKTVFGEDKGIMYCKIPVVLTQLLETETDDSGNKMTPLEERWEEFKAFHPYLDVDDVETNGQDIEKLILMNEQEKISIVGGSGDREDALLERVYQTQENTIQFLARIMVIKEELKKLNEEIDPIKEIDASSVQSMLTQKLIWDDCLDQLWALRRQLESLNAQYSVAKRGRSLIIKEPILYRYDPQNSTPEIKVINSKEGQ